MHSYPFISEKDFLSGCNEIIKAFNTSGALKGDWLDADIRSRNNQKYVRILKTARSCSFVDRENNPDDDDESVSSDVQEHDEKVHPCTVNRENLSTIEYHILHSPIYCVPVLWVIVLPEACTGKSQSEYIYEYIVPPELRRSTESAGLYGGLSLAEHPVLEVPAYFVHPCNTAEALQSLEKNDVKPAEYLMLWLGLVGGSVQLFVPPSLAIEIANE